MEIRANLDGISIVLKSIKKLRDNFLAEVTTTSEFNDGVAYAFTAIIETLEKLED